jgi:hypothetical protein
MAFSKVNNCLPHRIIMYRDGVGEGQLSFVFETEMQEITVSILIMKLHNVASFKSVDFRKMSQVVELT